MAVRELGPEFLMGIFPGVGVNFHPAVLVWELGIRTKGVKILVHIDSFLPCHHQARWGGSWQRAVARFGLMLMHPLHQ